MNAKDLIRTIPQFKSNNDELCGLSPDFLKNQLLISEERQDIIRLARGEGRKTFIKIIADPDLIFDWGVKSNHSLQMQDQMRDFLEPGQVSIDLLYEHIAKLEEVIVLHKERSPYVKGKIRIDELKVAVKTAKTQEDLVLLKEFICFFLHTAGNVKGFTYITPWISTSKGSWRYDTACFFGRRNKRYVIWDYWVPVEEHGQTYHRTADIIEQLKKLGITWYRDIHKEIMVKFAFFPHRIVGYYYLENNQLQYYFFNHHYLQRWAEVVTFRIGDYIYIPQDHVNFPAVNPYNLIYTYDGEQIGTFARR